MVLNFVRNHYPQAIFLRIYDATTDGWKNTDFHRCYDKKGWSLIIVETTKDFIFGGFTTAEWESPPPSTGISKPDPLSFLFSVNEGSKYPITGDDAEAIGCNSGYCAAFGGTGGQRDLVIRSDSNSNSTSYCYANYDSFKLPPARGSEGPSINGGENNFQLKQFEVYSVLVRININLTFRNNERQTETTHLFLF
jgi:hypothetical protein